MSADVILTAGHCAEDTATGSVNARRGYHVVTHSLDWTARSRQVSAVSRVIVNPGYDPATGRDDAALLVLTTPTTAPPIRLATAGDTRFLTPGTRSVIAGWGQTIGGDQASIPTALQYATTVVQSTGFCSQRVSPFDPQTQFCAIGTPSFATSACFGDSGGPLVANDFVGDTGVPTEVGITTEVESRCDATFPDIFTRVDAISSWAAGVIATAATAPPAGRYRGSTAQRWPISLRVANSRRTFTALKFSYDLVCRLHHHRLDYSIRTDGSGSIQKSGVLGFRVRFTDTGGVRYQVEGAFTPAGRASGTLRVVSQTPRYGTCDSGTVSWRALHTSGL